MCLLPKQPPSEILCIETAFKRLAPEREKKKRERAKPIESIFLAIFGDDPLQAPTSALHKSGDGQKAR